MTTRNLHLRRFVLIAFLLSQACFCAGSSGPDGELEVRTGLRTPAAAAAAGMRMLQNDTDVALEEEGAMETAENGEEEHDEEGEDHDDEHLEEEGAMETAENGEEDHDEEGEMHDDHDDEKEGEMHDDHDDHEGHDHEGHDHDHDDHGEEEELAAAAAAADTSAGESSNKPWGQVVFATFLVNIFASLVA